MATKGQCLWSALGRRCCGRCSVLHDVEQLMVRYPAMSGHWSGQQLIGSFGLIFNDALFVKEQKLRILCRAMECERHCDVVVSALSSYWTDCVDVEVFNMMMDSVRSAIGRLLESFRCGRGGALSIVDRVFGMLAVSTLDAMATPSLLVHQYPYSVPTMQSVLCLLAQCRSVLDSVDGIEAHSFLQCDYGGHLVRRLVAFYVRFEGSLPFDPRLVDSVLFLVGEWSFALDDGPIYNVFNSLLPDFASLRTSTQLTALTAMTKIFCASSLRKRAKMEPLLHHLLELGASPKDSMKLDVRWRAIMYRRLIALDVDAAKRICCSALNTVTR